MYTIHIQNEYLLHKIVVLFSGYKKLFLYLNKIVEKEESFEIKKGVGLLYFPLIIEVKLPVIRVKQRKIILK